MAKIQVKNVYKVFGSAPMQMISFLEKGEKKTDLLKKYKHSVGVNNVSFSVNEGEIFVVMGLSGSGKSTLIRCLNRLIEPTSGEIYIDNEKITQVSSAKLREIRRKKIAMVFQNFALLPHRTVLENVAFGLEIQKVDVEERKKKAIEMLEVVGLKGYENAKPKELSGGMQQRVGLARALATDADILLMDEAFSALDPLIRKEMQNELLSLQTKMQKTIVFITHDLDEALKIGDRIAIMKDGNIVQIGEPEEILNSPADAYVREFIQDVNRTKIVSASSIMRSSESIILEKAGVRTAAKKMKDLEISSIFVTDKHKTLLGIITIDKVSELMKENRDDLKSVIDTDIRTVGVDTSIDEIIPLFLQSGYPVAVVDDENKLKGIIFKSTVLAGIAGKEEVSIDS
ncbi:MULTISPECIES: quaternary amine ABC transporter ATP-binding protein [Clostridia]|jgi:glycine betaine/proline transport system ATP-binding protein|uniref:Quaternary amine transport ATP-binding protein n=1 Tax=Blautia producta TaxID=33035 RepID=A0A4P6LV46_9FIRM|nr:MULTISPECIES: glycine betaine/L-proline ABC transporter ATP-binding protein [Clostridia]MCQ5127968.1 glycine betaine/L-proline ABC transporter ATP-binding protein [Blautia producta]MDD3064456.1 glycine betaine/L-proline ABC transporter ATP-binding protein [Massilibacteroides sp.]MDT4377309.1 glycine betaine/L-proline ABC transporter ATP-binding protein [Blautia coccoides]QBE95000.1 Glycine betaine/carnitine transport ATP-binding protein GbuA [Blautia producta]